MSRVAQISPRRAARLLGVSESSLKRWCDLGKLPSTRTAGGHRRIPLRAVMAFARAMDKKPPVGDPGSSDSPPGHDRALWPSADQRDAVARCAAALRDGREKEFSELVWVHYVAGRSQAAICDRLITPALVQLGSGWEHGEVQIYEERRACEIVANVLRELRDALPAPRDGAPRALGGSLAHDPYILPNLMVELTLREAGYAATSLGHHLPPATLRHAVLTLKPRLFWVSIAVVTHEAALVTEMAQLYQAAASAHTALVLGGRGISADLRATLPYTSYCETLAHLAAFARALAP